MYCQGKYGDIFRVPVESYKIGGRFTLLCREASMRIGVGLRQKGRREAFGTPGRQPPRFHEILHGCCCRNGNGAGFFRGWQQPLPGKAPNVVYLHTAECTGCSEAMMRMYKPYMNQSHSGHDFAITRETIMAAAGHAAEEALEQAVNSPNGFICMVEGAIPTALDGKYGYVGGKTMYDICKGNPAQVPN